MLTDTHSIYELMILNRNNALTNALTNGRFYHFLLTKSPLKQSIWLSLFMKARLLGSWGLERGLVGAPHKVPGYNNTTNSWYNTIT